MPQRSKQGDNFLIKKADSSCHHTVSKDPAKSGESVVKTRSVVWRFFSFRINAQRLVAKRTRARHLSRSSIGRWHASERHSDRLNRRLTFFFVGITVQTDAFRIDYRHDVTADRRRIDTVNAADSKPFSRYVRLTKYTIMIIIFTNIDRSFDRRFRFFLP